jgi:hypothetical protein
LILVSVAGIAPTVAFSDGTGETFLSPRMPKLETGLFLKAWSAYYPNSVRLEWKYTENRQEVARKRETRRLADRMRRMRIGGARNYAAPQSRGRAESPTESPESYTAPDRFIGYRVLRDDEVLTRTVDHCYLDLDSPINVSCRYQVVAFDTMGNRVCSNVVSAVCRDVGLVPVTPGMYLLVNIQWPEIAARERQTAKLCRDKLRLHLNCSSQAPDTICCAPDMCCICNPQLQEGIRCMVDEINGQIIGKTAAEALAYEYGGAAANFAAIRQAIAEANTERIERTAHVASSTTSSPGNATTERQVTFEHHITREEQVAHQNEQIARALSNSYAATAGVAAVRLERIREQCVKEASDVLAIAERK